MTDLTGFNPTPVDSPLLMASSTEAVPLPVNPPMVGLATRPTVFSPIATPPFAMSGRMSFAPETIIRLCSGCVLQDLLASSKPLRPIIVEILLSAEFMAAFSDTSRSAAGFCMN